MFQTSSTWLRGIVARILDRDISRRVAKNSGYLFSTTGISGGLSFLQGVLSARLLGAADFGVLGAITMFTSVVNNLASFRMNELVIKFVGQYTEEGDLRRAAAVFKVAALVEMLASFLAFGLIYLLAPLGARLFAKDPNTASWFVIYGLVLLANLIAESSTGLLQIFDRFKRMASLAILQSVLTLALIIAAYLTQGGLLEILLAYLAGKVLGALGFTLAALREAGRRWGPDWWKAPISLLRPEAGRMVRFAVSTNLSASISLINKDSELLWISLFRSSTETGYYKLALALANLVQMPVAPLQQATYPELSREAARRNWGNLRYVLRKGSLVAGAYSLLATLGLLVLGRPLIQLVYKPEFLPAYPALLILLVGILVANTFYWRRTALLSLGHPGFATQVNLGLAVLKVVGIVLLVPLYGYLANAALLSGFYIFGVIFTVWKVQAILTAHEPAAGQPVKP